MRSLAQARDLASLSTYSRNLADRANKKTRNALSTVAEKLDDARNALPPLDLEAVRTDLHALLAMARVWREVSDRQIERGAERLARRARGAFKKGRGEKLAALRHEWRKREKDRLYAVTLLGESWPDDRKRRKTRGEQLAEALGRERDALMLIERLERNPLLAGSENSAKRVLKLLNQRRRKYGARADAIGVKLHRNGA